MADIEKVIKGLELVREDIAEVFTSGSQVAVDSLRINNAIELLKEQEKENSRIANEYLNLVKVASKQPQIVRCKDCKHKEESVSPSWEAWCNRLHCGCDNDWFCADGEAKE